MVHLLLVIISYGALLFLLMPASDAGILSSAVVLTLGIGLIIHKKVYKIAFWKSKQYLHMATTVFAAICFGLNFYIRWRSSDGVQAIATVLRLPAETVLLIGSVILSALSAYALYAALQIIINKLSHINQKYVFVRSLVFCLAASVMTVVFAQVAIGADALSMGYENFAWCVLIVSATILLLYCLLGRITPSVFIGAGMFMVISTINMYVYKFRGRLLEPVDVFSAVTALNVAENYSLLPIPLDVLAGWSMFVALLMVLCFLQRNVKSELSVKKRCILLAVCAISFVGIFRYSFNLKTYHWHTDGARVYGYVLDFAAKFKEIAAPKPDSYSKNLVDKLADEYAAESNGEENEPTEYPHIIVIMDEAFSDLRVLGEISTNKEVMPFISSLKENTVSGYALASVYGGNTANSEYEFLTGNSLAWLSPNVVPYQQYIRMPTYSMVSYLKSQYHYKCVAMHPYQSTGWNRPAAYKHLGFDACYFVEDFPQESYVRYYLSDREMFEFLIATYETQKQDPLFVFGVTMQNHGGYTYTGDRFTQHISLNDHGEQYPDVEQYLSLIHETDMAVEYLISYFQNVDEEVVIVFFGDHQPTIDESFYEAVSGTTADTLDEQQKRYAVPFFIWANYDIEEEQVACTSLNYLSSYVYDVAGIAMPPYNRFLQELETKIPAINANGFYSPASGCYLPFDKASEEEMQWLEWYKVLQYNSIFDKRNRNNMLFPVLE